MMFAGWVNRHQLDVIDYLQEENRVLKKRLSGRGIRFTDAERRQLARKAHLLGRKVLNELETMVTPDTLLRWHRQLVASKWNYAQRRGPGRPRVRQVIIDLILRMAEENPSWGYTRIRGALANLGHQVGRGTIANLLREHGIEPAPERDRHTRWSTFLKAHWECLTATDFLSVEVHTIRGLVTHYVREGLHLIRLPPQSPNLSAFAERFVRSIKSECLNRMIFFGQSSIRHAISQFMAHYHTERNHQGLENKLLRAAPILAPSHPVHRSQRLGRMLNCYHRAAA